MKESVKTIIEDICFIGTYTIIKDSMGIVLQGEKKERVQKLEKLYSKEIQVTKDIIENHISSEELSLTNKCYLSVITLLEVIVDKKFDEKKYEFDSEILLALAQISIEKVLEEIQLPSQINKKNDEKEIGLVLSY